MEPTRLTKNIGGAELTLETGVLAKQAHGSCVVRVGDTQILVTCVTAPPREGIDFFPLTVDVEERMYAAGKIPGGFFRREGRPSEQAILTARLIDRPLRPTFKTGFRNEVQVICTVLSVDQANPYDIPSINGASTAVMLAGLPFDGPIAAVRVALMGDQWKVNPTFQDVDLATFDMVVAGRRNDQGEIDILMVEGEAPDEALPRITEGAPAPTEERVEQGLEVAKRHIGELVDLQQELLSTASPATTEFPIEGDYEEGVMAEIEAFAGQRVREALAIAAKHDREEALGAIKADLAPHLTATWGEEGYLERREQVSRAFKALEKKLMRRRIVEEGVRLDGRKPEEIRQISCEVGLVPRAHGSGLFQRGETQVLNVTTLGMLRMTQMIDTIHPEDSKRYMHHYNFPPFSTGEASFMRGPKRREIGHGALAERALLPVIPSEDEFPYAIRLVSDVLESNGSTSMASVCASTLSLMDAGVPIRAPVAGIAMGLIADDGQFVTLTDILGAEDALGDMDFKVAGTKEFVTAIQLDTKVTGLPAQVLAGALKQALEARLFILDKMLAIISEPRTELAAKAPRVIMKQVPVDKIGEVIGPKGKMINSIIAETGASVDVEDDGRIFVGGTDGDSVSKALEMIEQVVNPRMPEVGERFEGTVVKLTDFGAFVNLTPAKDGLLHVSKMARGSERVESPADVLSVGEKIEVVVREVDRAGRISLDRVWGDEVEGASEGAPSEQEERRRPEGDRGEERRPDSGRRPREGDGDRPRRRRRRITGDRESRQDG